MPETSSSKALMTPQHANGFENECEPRTFSRRSMLDLVHWVDFGVFISTLKMVTLLLRAVPRSLDRLGARVAPRIGCAARR